MYLAHSRRWGSAQQTSSSCPKELHSPSMATHDFQDKANPEGWSPLSTSNLNSPFRILITGTGPPSMQPLKLTASPSLCPS